MIPTNNNDEIEEILKRNFSMQNEPIPEAKVQIWCEATQQHADFGWGASNNTVHVEGDTYNFTINMTVYTVDSSHAHLLENLSNTIKELKANPSILKRFVNKFQRKELKP